MSIVSGVVGDGRFAAASRFTETFDVYTVTRVGPDANGRYTDMEVFRYQNVPGRVKYPTLTVSEREQGGQVLASQDIHIHTAVGSVPLAVVNTLWRVVASTADPGLVGRKYRTKGQPQAGQVTATRTPVEEIS